VINILVVEDEAIVARRLLRLLKSLLAVPFTVQHKDTLDDAHDYLAQHSIDLLLLDLNLYGGDGFAVLKTLVAQSFHTIVISANSDRAIEAFEYGVLDFVAKPFSEQRLTKALDRYLNKESTGTSQTRFLSVRTSKGLELISLADIDYIQSSDNYSVLRLLSGRELLHDKSLTALQQILPAEYFRSHKSFLINLARVAVLKSNEGSRYQVTLQSGSVLPVGRSRVIELRMKLKVF